MSDAAAAWLGLSWQLRAAWQTVRGLVHTAETVCGTAVCHNAFSFLVCALTSVASVSESMLHIEAAQTCVAAAVVISCHDMV